VRIQSWVPLICGAFGIEGGAVVYGHMVGFASCKPADPLVVDFRCCLCDRVDFCPAVFYTVCGGSHPTGVVVNLHRLTCRRLLTFVFKNRQCVPI